MAPYSNIYNIKLETCCQKAIDRINQRLKLGNILSVGIGSALWLNIFGPSPSTLNTIVAVHQTDFQTLKALVQATGAISAISKKAALSDCEGEWYHHIGNTKLESFWKGMMDAFSE